MATRKLADRLASAAGLAMTKEPQVAVPKIDKAATLADVAKQGIEAIDALHAERNKMVELSASLHRENVHVRNVNIALRAEVDWLKKERDLLIRSNARLGSYVAQFYDMFQRIASEVGHVTTVIEQMPPPPHVSNNPDAPPLDAVGLPIEEADPMPSFDQNGMPSNGGVPLISIDELNILKEQLAKVD